jgi:hypothetical protein
MPETGGDAAPDSLTVGGKAGIALGVAIPVLLFIIAAWILIRRRRAHTRNESDTKDAETMPELDGKDNAVHELELKEPKTKGRAELDSQSIHELSANPKSHSEP